MAPNLNRTLCAAATSAAAEYPTVKQQHQQLACPLPRAGLLLLRQVPIPDVLPLVDEGRRPAAQRPLAQDHRRRPPDGEQVLRGQGTLLQGSQLAQI